MPHVAVWCLVPHGVDHEAGSQSGLVRVEGFLGVSELASVISASSHCWLLSFQGSSGTDGEARTL